MRELNTDPQHDTNGTVYEYVKVTVSNVDDTNIARAFIEFSVPKSWLEDNDFTTENVVAFRYNLDTEKWNELNTLFVGENLENFIFKATTNGFEDFLIVGREKLEAESLLLPPSAVFEPEPQPELEPIEEPEEIIDEPVPEIYEDEPLPEIEFETPIPTGRSSSFPIRIDIAIIIAEILIALGLLTYIFYMRFR